MDFFYSLIDSCDLVVYSGIAGFVTEGVASEVLWALESNKEVYRLDWRTNELKKIYELTNERLDAETSRLLSKILWGLGIDECELALLVRNVKNRKEALTQLARGLEDREARPRQGINLDPLGRFYHWWQEPRGTMLPIDVRALATLIVEKMKEVRTNKLTDALRKLGVSKARLTFYGDVLRGTVDM